MGKGYPRKSIRDFKEFREFEEALDKGFVIERDGTKVTNPELLDLAEGMANALYKGTGFRQRADTINQFRKFFNEVRGLQKLVKNTSKLGVGLRMLRARMGYAAGRQTISEDFSIVINTCIDKILQLGNFEKQIEGFCNFFESLYAYYYYHTKIR